jgi:hypothetical protein
MTVMRAEGSRKPSKAEIAAATPGIRLGARMPIEAATEARAARLRVTSREELSDVLVIDVIKNADYYFETKTLDSDESRRAYWIPRYHPTTGIVYTTRWVTAPTETTNGRQRLIVKEGERYETLRAPQGIGKVDLYSLRPGWITAKLVPQRLQTIESALRQQNEIAHDYNVDGPEFGRVEEISAAIRMLSIQFIQDHPRLDSDFQELQGQLAEFFARHGLERSTSRIWQRVWEKIVKSAQKDSLGRPNPSASRFRLGSAMLGTVTREVVTSLTREKSGRVYARLFAEREVERGNLAWASTELLSIQGKTKQFVVMGPGRLSNRQITEVRGDLKIADAILSQVRVSPYLEIASLARQFVANETFRRKYDNDQIDARLNAHNLGMEFEHFEGVSAEEYLMGGRTSEALRILRGSITLLNSCLEDPQNHDIDVFGHHDR